MSSSNHLCSVRSRSIALLVLACAPALVAASPAPERRSAFEEAWALYEAGQPSFEAFQHVLDDATQPAKDRFNAAYVLAVQSLARREPERALELCTRADQLLAGRPQVALRRTEALVNLRRLEEAQAALDAVKLGESSSPELWLRHGLTRAKLHQAKGESDLAIEILKRLGDEHPEDWETFYLMGLVYESWDLPEDALAAYERTIENDPKRDPFPGIYAYQRWAAMTISMDPAAYDNRPKKQTAIAHYKSFLERADANHVPEGLVDAVRQAVNALESFGA